MPPLGDDAIYDLAGVVDPKHPQIKKHKKHMDGGIHTTLYLLDKHEPFIHGQGAAKGEATQLAGEGITPAQSAQQDLAALHMQ